MAANDGLPPWLRPMGGDVWQLLVHVQPGAKKNELAGEMDGRLKLRIAAQAVDNKANKALLAFVAAILGVKPRNVSLENGDASRRKTLLITATDKTDIMAKLCAQEGPEAGSRRT